MNIYTFEGFFPDGKTTCYINADTLEKAIHNLQTQHAFLYNTAIQQLDKVSDGYWILMLQDVSSFIYTIKQYKIC